MIHSLLLDFLWLFTHFFGLLFKILLSLGSTVLPYNFKNLIRIIGSNRGANLTALDDNLYEFFLLFTIRVEIKPIIEILAT